MSSPQGLTDAIAAAFASKDVVEASLAAKQAAAASLATAKAADDAAAQDLANKAAALDTSRKTLEALFDVYLTPGGQLPDPAPASAPPGG